MIHLTPSVLNAYALLCNEEQKARDIPGYRPWFTEDKFKKQVLGQEPMSEKAHAGQAVHHAVYGGGKDDVAGWVVDPSVTSAIAAVNGSRIDDDGIAEVPFVMEYPELGARVYGRSDKVYTTNGHELKTTSSVDRLTGIPDIAKYAEAPQTLAYVTHFGIPFTIYLAHIKISKPRPRPKGIKGYIHLDPDDSQPVRSVTVNPSENVKKTLDAWVEDTIYYVSRDYEILCHLLKKGERDLKEL